nr:MADS-box protein JOINTLESS-like [Ipomoea trifida]
MKHERCATCLLRHVVVIVFSSTGKLFDFASSSMKHILQKYVSHPSNIKKYPPLEFLQQENNLQVRLSKEISDKTYSHLASGEKESDGLRRNVDVAEILDQSHVMARGLELAVVSELRLYEETRQQL